MRNIRRFIPILLLFGLLGCSELVQPAAPHEGELALQAQRRPISDFVEAQGTFCFPDGQGGCLLFVPPVANFFGFFGFDPRDRERVLSASVDYAGLAADYLESEGIDLGTSFRGKVTERSLRDGRCFVHVVLHTRNALTWVVEGFSFATGELLFGARPTDVVGGATPSLGSSKLAVRFTNTACGEDLPDLFQLVFAPEPGQELLFISLIARADGRLADGGRGRVQVTQVGLIDKDFFFPAQNIILRRVGGR
jgi:hypothetical protein